jgi:hypothetical protein
MNVESICILTPSYGDTLTTHYSVALSDIRVAISAGFGIPVSVEFVSGSLVQQCRNMLVERFRRSRCSHALWLDADESVSVRDTLAMIMVASAGHELVGLPVPIKLPLDWEAARAVAAAGGSAEDVQAATIRRFNVRFLPEHLDPSGAYSGEVRTIAGHRVIPVASIGTGALMHSRALVERLIEAHPETKYSLPTGETEYALFNTEIREGRFASEDTLFCLRARALGAQPLALVDARVAHYGQHAWVGDFGGWLARRSAAGGVSP